MQPYLIGLYEKSMPNELTLVEKLRCAGEADYDYLELSIDETDEKLARLDWDDETIMGLLKEQLESGIAIKSICLSGHRRFPLGHPDLAIQHQSLAIMKKAIALAARLGVRVIQIAGYDVYYEKGTEETRKNFYRNLKASVNLAARNGVTLAFETMETDFLNTVEKAMYWVKKINSPWLQVYPDIGNITNATLAMDADPLEDLELGLGHISAVHLKETVPGVFREVPYGTGHVNFVPLVAAALHMGVRMFVTEFWYTGEPDFRTTLSENRAFMADVFTKALR